MSEESATQTKALLWQSLVFPHAVDALDFHDKPSGDAVVSSNQRQRVSVQFGLLPARRVSLIIRQFNSFLRTPE